MKRRHRRKSVPSFYIPSYPTLPVPLGYNGMSAEELHKSIFEASKRAIEDSKHLSPEELNKRASEVMRHQILASRKRGMIIFKEAA